MPQLTEIWRYPIKSHGREALEQVTLVAGQTMPGDRVWAIAHEASTADGSAWAHCSSFTRAAKAPGLAAIAAQWDEARGLITLTHPDRPGLTLDPDTEGQRLIDWAGGFVPDSRPASARVVRAQAQNFTDSPYPSVTLGNLASHRAVAEALGVADLSPLRWRCNLWVEGLAPWAEFDLIGQEISVGGAVLRVRERTTRCLMTHANPMTGARDLDVLAALDSFGHRDMTVQCEVIQGGPIARGDEVTP